ncbi:hypothetical protein GCM10009092_06370 [Bowmanella denitrificans]|uniref:Lipopolysaccharide assembly protein A domain-containing protein n=1 Tax=Bowmanella denitrificans TaxID=366582 RepID=A0ABN0WR48_9ALTE|nr:lipopolysaccharide assembly protein LapA domain-containing protein [Bowmanella denitrificans]
MKLILSLLLALALFLLALAIGAQNDQLVQVNYLIAQSQLRLSSLMAVMFVAGALSCLLLCVLWFIGFRWRGRQRNSQATKPRDS